MHTVKSLRDSGFKVRVYHCRRHRYVDSNFHIRYTLVPTGVKNSLSCCGGETHIKVTSPDDIVAKSISVCGKKDAYCKKTGVRIALGRAMKLLEYEQRLVALEIKENILPLVPKVTDYLS